MLTQKKILIFQIFFLQHSWCHHFFLLLTFYIFGQNPVNKFKADSNITKNYTLYRIKGKATDEINN